MKSLLILLLCLSSQSYASYLVQSRTNVDGSTEILNVKRIQNHTAVKKLYKSLPEKIVEGQDGPKQPEALFQEWIVNEKEFSSLKVNFKRMNRAGWAGSEVRNLVVQGDPKNRIDLPIVAEGYTIEEKEKFFADAERIKNELFAGPTYQVYSALFNVYAVFVPSRDSGVTDTVRKNTALGLYRNPPNSKRAIMYDSTEAIDRAIALAPDDDYPILLVNDDYYGGLGGRYAITTRSEASGIVVLRHELGHNFSSVGEEYDGGGVYTGANFSATKNVPWKHWTQNNQVEVFESQFLTGQYLWKNLNEGPIQSSFKFPAGDYDFDMDISSVGWSTPQDVLFSIDGVVRKLSGVFIKDRSFYQLAEPLELKSGNHEMKFEEKVKDGDNILAFAMTYAHPKNLKRDEFYGAYSTFNSNEVRVGYRPTFKSCLMRDMTTNSFCSVDRENMWIRFLNVLSLIDDVKVNEVSGNKKAVKVNTLALENLTYHWYVKSASGWELLDLTGPVVELDSSTQTYKVVVEFKTEQVQKPGQRFVSERVFQVN